jgi:hypothetical protein
MVVMLALPRVIVLLEPMAAGAALNPMTVLLEPVLRLTVTAVLAPMSVLQLPVDRKEPAFPPTPTLQVPPVTKHRAFAPTAVFKTPDTDPKELYPTAVLQFPPKEDVAPILHEPTAVLKHTPEKSLAAW